MNCDCSSMVSEVGERRGWVAVMGGLERRGWVVVGSRRLEDSLLGSSLVSMASQREYDRR